MIEEWRPVVGWEGFYEVSDLGRVRSVYRRYRDILGRPRVVVGCILTPVLVKDGYLQYSLKNPARTMKGHTLVLRAFVGPRPAGRIPRHLNGDPADNKWLNLAYGTVGENNADMVRHGTHRNARKVACGLDHLLVMPNLRADSWVEGRRECLACGRTSPIVSRARRLGRSVPDFRSLADAKYAVIMAHPAMHSQLEVVRQ